MAEIRRKGYKLDRTTLDNHGRKVLTGRVHVGIYAPRALYDALAEVAAEQDTNVSALVRRLLISHSELAERLKQ